VTADEMRTLFDYNYWANGKILTAAAGMGAEELSAPASLRHGSLLATLVHTLAVEWMWRTRCEKGDSPPRYIPPERFLGVESVQVAWAEEEKATRAFLGTLTDGRLNEPVRYASRRGESREAVLWQVLVHVVNHGTHHRAEAGLRLAELGRNPGDMDFLLYLRS
jgi:uncharacterized damage-inducible protein DinB